MIQDPANRYIAALMALYDLSGKDVLELGCGRGRITRDLARYARFVMATDPDGTAIEAARAAIPAGNVEFRVEPAGMPALPGGSFDAVIYTLSLHHVPQSGLAASLAGAAALLREEGVIIVLEPGDGGSFTAAKERFGAGSGDERQERAAAVRAMRSLDGWDPGETVIFSTRFRFDDENDFLVSMLPGFTASTDQVKGAVMEFLARHRNGDSIILDAERRLNVLRRKR